MSVSKSLAYIILHNVALKCRCVNLSVLGRLLREVAVINCPFPNGLNVAHANVFRRKCQI